MKPLPLFLVLASLAAPVLAQTPQCAPPGAGPSSTNWGQDYRERVEEIFNAAKQAAGVDQPVLLINVNDLQKKNAGTRQVDGSPISALPKGTQGIQQDAVIYTFGVFEIACDEAQLATFMLHEMRHLKKVDGKSHFDRVNDCRKQMFDKWACGTDLTAYPDDKAIVAAFNSAKGKDVQTQCVLPVEKEADAFAFETLPKLPYKTNAGTDPNRDARAQAFKNAEAWSVAIGDAVSDPGHGCLADRAQAGADASAKEMAAQHQKEQELRLQSFVPGAFGN